MSKDDFIDIKEIMKLTGYSQKSISNMRSIDPNFPKRLKGKNVMFMRDEFFAWFTNRPIKELKRKSA